MSGPSLSGETDDSGGLSNLLYRYPRLLVLSLALIAVAGISSYQLLPRAEDPSLSRRVARVVTRFPGASPERVEALITEKIEQELQEVEEIRLMRSESRTGVSAIVIELADEVSPDATGEIWSRVRDHVDDAAALLPPGASEPELEEMAIEAFTLITALVWQGDGDPDYNALRRLGEGLQDRLRAAPGTEEVELYGAPREEVRVELDPLALTTLGRTAGDLAAEIAGTDAKVPAGSLRGPVNDLLVEVEGELDTLARIRAVPVRQGADGRVVRLGDVARVERTVADPADELALIDGRPAVVVAARMSLGERVGEWSVHARQRVDDYRSSLPSSVELQTIFDQSRYTSARLQGLTANLLMGVGLVMAVMLLVMGWRSALLVGVALPLTTLMVFAGMKALGIPLHQMSVTGLIIALGLLIDNAIVVVDEVQHRLGEGQSRAAAISGSVRHLSVPLLSSTVTTVLAFAPMVLLVGPAGEFVGAIGSSVILALVSSLILALTVIPTLSGLLAPSEPVSAGRGPWYQAGVSHPLLAQLFRGGLRAALRRPLLGVSLSVVLPLLGFWGGTQLDEQFFPPSDRDQVRLDLRMPTQTPIGHTLETARRAREILREHPQVANVHWFVGRAAPKYYYNMMGGQDGAAYFAQALVQLHSPEGAGQVIRELQASLDAELPQAQSILRQLEQGPPFEAPVELHLQGPDLRVLRRLGDEARLALSTVPRVVHTRTTLAGGQPKLWLELQDDEARQAGLSNAEIASQLEGALGGALGGSLLEGTEELPVRVRLLSEDRSQVSRLQSLDLLGGAAVGPGGGQRPAVPVSAIGELHLRPQLATISHRNAQRTNSVQGYLEAGVLPSTVLAGFRVALEERGFELPPGYTMQIGGESENRDRAVRNLLASAALLLVMMVASLVLAFNSFRQAALIATVGALAAGLAMGALYVFGFPFGFMAIVGAMGLLGVAINDAIVVLAAIREDPAASQGDVDALERVVMRSSRHVIATTLTTVAGFMPLLIAGGEFWTSLSTAIAGGVAGATLLALFFVPAAYLILIRLGMRCPLRNGCDPS